jgi:hypothetical protein
LRPQEGSAFVALMTYVALAALVTLVEEAVAREVLGEHV